MKPPFLVRTLLALLGPALFAGPEIRTVTSIAPGAENPTTARISPESNLSPTLAQFIAAQLSPLVAGTEIFTVIPTGSMRPAFDDNTVLLTEPAPFRDLQIGDIVVFEHRGRGLRVAHRIVERRPGGFWTKGDHNARMDDELVTEANYVGRVYGILYTTRSKGAPLAEPLRRDVGTVAASIR